MKNAPIPAFIEHLKQEGKQSSTTTQYGKVLFKLQSHHAFPISDLSYEEIIDHLKSIGGRGTWRSTVAIVMKEFYKWLVNQGYRTDNPIKHLKVSQPKAREYPALTLQEYNLILAVARPKIRDLLLHLRWTGLRVSEALDTRKDDFMLNRVDAQGNPAPEMLVRGKGGTNIYLPLLNPKHVAWLKKRFFIKQSHDKLFPLSYHQAWYGINRAAEKAGVQRMLYDEAGKHRYYVTPHAIRRLFATWALQTGFDITMVQQLLRHKNINTTMRYAKVNNDMIRTRWQKLMVTRG